MYTIAIHGGAESIEPGSLTPDQEREYLAGLNRSLSAGYAVLDRGGRALDAVEQAVKALEDNVLFNAGKGAVFTNKQTHELDASIMCGRTLQAGVVSCVSTVRNPIQLARAVLDHSEHVFLSGPGAEAFAREQGFDVKSETYFFSQQRFDELLEALAKSEEPVGKETVGAVALDSHGDLAVATSTGGTNGQHIGRVGDSAVIGAGTYANNQTCAVSCTGDGEYFIRSVTAYDLSCLLAYKGLPLREACDQVILDKLTKMGGEGGLIAVTTSGQVELVFNTTAMFRGWRTDRDEGKTVIFR